jgi:hypothetical protein
MVGVRYQVRGADGVSEGLSQQDSKVSWFTRMGTDRTDGL